MGRLERHLDQDLIALIEAGSKRPERTSTKRRKPRLAATYRAARRNRALRTDRGVWRGIKPNGAAYRPPVRANRSRKWNAFPGGRLYAIGAR